MSSSPRRRVAWVDAGRGFAIVMVVLLHATDWLRSIGFEQPIWTVVALLLSSVRLPLFFTISGLFARKWVEGDWGDLWRSKLSLFVWVYLLWSGIASVTFTAGLRLQGQDATILSQVYATVSTLWLPRFELWFIWALSVFFVLAKLTRRIPFLLLLALAAGVSLVAFSELVQGNNGVEGTAKYFFFFLLGLRFRDRILHFGESITIWVKLGILATWAGIAGVGIFLGARESVFGFAFVTSIAGAIAGIGISTWLAAVPVLHRLGSQTLPIYLAHTSWIILMCWPLVEVSPDARSWPGAVVLPPLLAVIATWLSLVLAKIGSKTRWARYLFEQPPFLLGRSNSRLGVKSSPTEVTYEARHRPEFSGLASVGESAKEKPEVGEEEDGQVPNSGHAFGEGLDRHAGPGGDND